MSTTGWCEQNSTATSTIAHRWRRGYYRARGWASEMLSFNGPLTFFLTSFGMIWIEFLFSSCKTLNALYIFSYCKMFDSFCFTCPGIGRLGDAWRRWFRLRTKGQTLREASKYFLLQKKPLSIFWSNITKVIGNYKGVFSQFSSTN